MNSLNYNQKIAIVIPYYNASKQITRVVSKIPSFINLVIIVDDKSKESLPKKEILKSLKEQTNCVFLENKINLGVGGATKHGFNYAISNDIDIVIKVDADDQMDLSYIPELLSPIVTKEVSMTKGNRFKDFTALKKMPFLRKFGNLGLSFLTKVATGYWHNFDPTNGFLAIKTSTLKKIDFSKINDRYYFETSLLSQLYFEDIVIEDISMPAIYGDEKSNMNVFKMFFVFSKNLTKTFIKRIIKRYFLYDFNIGSLYILIGIPLFLFGVIFGVYNWYYYSSNDTFTPTGTIMIITISIILGFQLILQAIQVDILNAPNKK
ncbi:glycosyltransferase family 2 protein [Tenacibaculum sp. E3R01]|uniref:glycosyltransferase family 2 protein n=1 Tax=Tenacibaculum sp. E3R01 TaxID=2267227 RepID=UPI000DEBCAC6|nr:glycosyltransferase family 2 protein [Tenacibaculum sp. E3R01]RBW63004.1 glycosyltransferase family 2 protein [Tenacibaculum sp. E3R01]